ncbi:glycine-rich cell wall structural protein 1.8-like [Tribolium madens]|uniref:glycine-rich cell wall structural protein 1.8-like n=1 Tax=Tribolium madens TaxID=41895 RepID=UPI001CF72312|nr:glycine-rich cell wall structural protein 1.8-like [Tribolium madens]
MKLNPLILVCASVLFAGSAVAQSLSDIPAVCASYLNGASSIKGQNWGSYAKPSGVYGQLTGVGSSPQTLSFPSQSSYNYGAGSTNSLQTPSTQIEGYSPNNLGANSVIDSSNYGSSSIGSNAGQGLGYQQQLPVSTNYESSGNIIPSLGLNVGQPNSIPTNNYGGMSGEQSFNFGQGTGYDTSQKPNVLIGGSGIHYGDASQGPSLSGTLAPSGGVLKPGYDTGAQLQSASYGQSSGNALASPTTATSGGLGNIRPSQSLDTGVQNIGFGQSSEVQPQIISGGYGSGNDAGVPTFNMPINKDLGQGGYFGKASSNYGANTLGATGGDANGYITSGGVSLGNGVVPTRGSNNLGFVGGSERGGESGYGYAKNSPGGLSFDTARSANGLDGYSYASNAGPGGKAGLNAAGGTNGLQGYNYASNTGSGGNNGLSSVSNGYGSTATGGATGLSGYGYASNAAGNVGVAGAGNGGAGVSNSIGVGGGANGYSYANNAAGSSGLTAIGEGYRANGGAGVGNGIGVGSGANGYGYGSSGLTAIGEGYGANGGAGVSSVGGGANGLHGYGYATNAANGLGYGKENNGVGAGYGSAAGSGVIADGSFGADANGLNNLASIGGASAVGVGQGAGAGGLDINLGNLAAAKGKSLAYAHSAEQSGANEKSSSEVDHHRGPGVYRYHAKKQNESSKFHTKVQKFVIQSDRRSR